MKINDCVRISIGDVKFNFSDILNRVYYKNESFILLRHGKAVAAIVPCNGEENEDHQNLIQEGISGADKSEQDL